MFFEAMVLTLSNGQRPNGMIIRLQGFDKGVFGGTFTHQLIVSSAGARCVLFQRG